MHNAKNKTGREEAVPGQPIWLKIFRGKLVRRLTKSFLDRKGKSCCIISLKGMVTYAQ
jgi:hypothetical protein